jgi:hypothetical protein
LRGKLDSFVAFAPRYDELRAINHVVIAGLDPAIHAAKASMTTRFYSLHVSMGHRVKPGGDEGV